MTLLEQLQLMLDATPDGGQLVLSKEWLQRHLDTDPSKQASDGDWYNTGELARREGVTAQTIRRRCVAGVYRGATKRGKLWYIPASTILPHLPATEPTSGPARLERLRKAPGPWRSRSPVRREGRRLPRALTFADL